VWSDRKSFGILQCEHHFVLGFRFCFMHLSTLFVKAVELISTQFVSGCE